MTSRTPKPGMTLSEVSETEVVVTQCISHDKVAEGRLPWHAVGSRATK